MLSIWHDSMLFARWCRETTAMAMMETVILFPVLLTLLLGCFDLGQGIIINQKVIGASQIMADLVARNRNVDRALMDDIVAAGRLALEPSNVAPFGYDIASVEYDEDGVPTVLWRITENADLNDAAIASAEGLGGAGDGIIVVTVNYAYTPLFANFLVDTITMEEVAFLKGRRSAIVACADC